MPKKVRHGKSVRLVDLLPNPPDPRAKDVISNYRFERCTVIGPAVIRLEGCTIAGDNTHIEGGGTTQDLAVESVLWEVNPRMRPGVVGAVLIKDCEFIDCRFAKIGFTGTAVDMQQIRVHMQPPPSK